MGIETNILEQRIIYNEACNKYTTYIAKFPQSIYAKLYGFKPYDFIEVDEDAMKFKDIDY